MTGRTNSGAGGGGVYLHVVGGTTQPSDPRENTVWVNTDAEITSWVIQYEEPSAPADGMVWIRNQSTANNILNVMKRGTVEVGIGTAKQYNATNEAWETLTGSVYANGAWTSLELYVYKDGELNEQYEFTGRTTGTGASSVTLEEDYIQVNGVGNTSQWGYTSEINIKDVNTVEFSVEVNKSGYGVYYVSVGDQGTGESAAYSNSRVMRTLETTEDQNHNIIRVTVSLDVSSLEGKHRIYLGNHAGMNITAGGYLRCYSIQLI